MIIDTLIKKMSKLEAPICVGLDPTESLMPSFLKDAAYKKMGQTPAALAEVFLRFNKEIIDNVYDLVPALKIQIAMYEYLGLDGLNCYIETINYAKEKGLIIIGDIKRGDITSSAAAYSHAHMGRVTVGESTHKIFCHDIVTLAPYMGYDSIEPFAEDAVKYDKGMFILVKTSNPNSHQIQDIKTSENKPLHEHVAKLVSDWGKSSIGAHGYSAVGAVVGCTYMEEAMHLRALMPHTFFLLPGYGAQGATGAMLKPLLAYDNYGAIVNSSRGIIGAYKNNNNYHEQDFGKAARDATLNMKEDLLQ